MKCKLLFQSDCQVHLQPQIIPPNMEEYMSSLLTAVLPSVLNKFRIYLSLLRLLDYSISDEVTKVWTLPNTFSIDIGYIWIQSTLVGSYCIFPVNDCPLSFTKPKQNRFHILTVPSRICNIYTEFITDKKQHVEPAF